MLFNRLRFFPALSSPISLNLYAEEMKQRIPSDSNPCAIPLLQNDHTPVVLNEIALSYVALIFRFLDRCTIVPIHLKKYLRFVTKNYFRSLELPSTLQSTPLYRTHLSSPSSSSASSLSSSSSSSSLPLDCAP